MAMVLYLVVPCYNEEEIIEDSASRLAVKMKTLMQKGLISNNSKVVFVNDGSVDATGSLIHSIREENDMFSVINFSRNFGHQNAVMAGYMFSHDKCDAVISLDADLQQDIDAIDEFIEKFNEGYEVVYGVRNSRDTDGFFKKLTSQIFYKIMQIFGCETIPNHADYRLLSNRVLGALAEYKETNVFLRGLIPTLGFNSCIVHFEVHERAAGKSKYSLKKMVNLAVDGITSHSIRPMHIIFSLGWLVLLLAFIYFIYIIVVLVMDKTVPGWTSLVMSIWILGGLQLIAIGCIGEYVGKNYLETKNRPRYIIESVEHNQ